MEPFQPFHKHLIVYNRFSEKLKPVDTRQYLESPKFKNVLKEIKACDKEQEVYKNFEAALLHRKSFAPCFKEIDQEHVYTNVQKSIVNNHFNSFGIFIKNSCSHSSHHALPRELISIIINFASNFPLFTFDNFIKKFEIDLAAKYNPFLLPAYTQQVILNYKFDSYIESDENPIMQDK